MLNSMACIKLPTRRCVSRVDRIGQIASQNPQRPLFRSACAVDLSNRDWKSAPPCSQAMLMAAFLSLATTMNFDGLSPLWLRNVTTYVLATAGANLAEKLERGKAPL